MNDVLFEKYLTDHLIQAVGSRPTLFSLDLMGSHKTSTILELFRTNNITPSLIPTRCPSLIQPLDVSINKPFKELIRDITNEKIFELESAAEFEKWTVGDRRVMTTHCVGQAFDQFHSNKSHLISTSFRKFGLSLPIDGSSDHELDIKGFSELEFGEWTEDLSLLDDRVDVGNEEDHDIEFVDTRD